MHYEYISTLILEKLLRLLRDFNQFYDERYVKFSVSENRSIFGISGISVILKFCLINMCSLM